MKNIFKGFHNVEQEKLEQLWKNDKTLFVFDANVLLNLYGYAIQTRNDFFKILDSISSNIWIPYHAGLEYQRRRLTVIKNEKSVFNEIESNLDKIQNVFNGDFEQLALKRRFPKLFENTEKLEKEIKKSIVSYKKSVAHWNNEQPCVRSHDSIRDKINDLFENKVGDKPENQEWLEALYKEGAERFKNKIPPGFKDAGKAKKDEDTHFYYDGLTYERQFGDLIIWKQLIEKSQAKEINNVVFVTDDAKDDWWFKINSNGKKVVGPLAELQAEIYSESNIDAFHMYSTSMFMKDGESYMEIKVEESSIIDAGTPHIRPKHKQEFDNLVKITKSQNKAIENYVNDKEFNSEKYKQLLSNDALVDALDKYKTLNSSEHYLSEHLDKYKFLSEQTNLDIYKDIFEKYDNISKQSSWSKYKDILDKYENLRTPSEIYKLINKIKKSERDDSDDED
tara:strand:+ start:2327 stop:3676 length:1350 start_codon:yes stop_codon:yes gene_type:complete